MQRIHNLLNSREGFGDAEGNVLAVSKVVLTAAEIKLLFTTPQTLVPAPGAGRVVLIDSIVAFLDYSTAVFTGANDLEFRETNGAGTTVIEDLSFAFLNSAADAIAEVSGSVYWGQVTRLANKSIVVAVPVANPGGATAASTLTILTFYRIAKLF